MNGTQTKLTPRQAAEWSGVSLSLVYQWCDERRLTHYRAGGRGRRGKILIDPADLDAFLATLKVEAGPGEGGISPGLRHINLPRPS